MCKSTYRYARISAIELPACVQVLNLKLNNSGHKSWKQTFRHGFYQFRRTRSFAFTLGDLAVGGLLF
jgi:hypothetical protein